MAAVCHACRSPERQKIDERLLAGRPEREIAKEFGLSRGAVHRHKEGHLAQRLARARQVEERRGDEQVHERMSTEMRQDRDLSARLKELAVMAREIYDEARKTGNFRTALGAINQLCRNVELEAKISGLINSGVMVNVNNIDVSKLSEDEVLALQDKLWERCPRWTLKMVRSITDDLDAEEARQREERTRRAAEAAAAQGRGTMPSLVRSPRGDEVARPAATYAPDAKDELVHVDDEKQWTVDEIRAMAAGNADAAKPSASPARELTALEQWEAEIAEAQRTGKLQVPGSPLRQGTWWLSGPELEMYIRQARKELERGGDEVHESGRPYWPLEIRHPHSGLQGLLGPDPTSKRLWDRRRNGGGWGSPP